MHPEGLKFHVRNSKGTIGGQFYIAESVIREWWNKSFTPLLSGYIHPSGLFHVCCEDASACQYYAGRYSHLSEASRNALNESGFRVLLLSPNGNSGCVDTHIEHVASITDTVDRHYRKSICCSNGRHLLCFDQWGRCRSQFSMLPRDIIKSSVSHPFCSRRAS